jgi:hypothetical protein
MLHRMALLAVLTIIIADAWPAHADEKKADPPKRQELDIRPVSQDAWGNNKEYVRAVLASGADTLWVHFPGRPLPPILVEPQGGPITLYDRGRNGEYRVRLDTADNLWAQWTFQFAHEFGHILSNYDEVRHQNKWFEETICEVSSLYVLRKLADTWARDPSPPNWKRYAPALRKYAEDRIRKATLPEGQTLAQWYEANARQLTRTGEDRDRNTVVAVQLLPLFEKSPDHWEAITWLAKAKKGHGESLAEFLKAWQAQCPAKHRAFVAAVADMFAINLDKVQPGQAK